MSRPRELLMDPYGRVVNSLRISVTQRCNFDCFFCHREGEHGPNGEMTPEEIGEIVSVAAGLGVNKVKITGGEPLERPDIVDIVKRVAPHVSEVSMTTNASGLDVKAGALKAAGLRRVNVSLHSLRPDIFKKITGCECVDEVENGVKAAVRVGLTPVKLNVVVIKGLNSDEIPNIIEFSKEVGAIVQLIEYQPLERGAEGFDEHHFDLKPLEERLAAEAVSVVERDIHRRKQYRLAGGAVVEVVRPMHNTMFCRYCTRLRVTSDGRLKPCLMRDDNLIELVSHIRRGEPGEALVGAFREATSRREPYWRD
jgi:cyclic pyranopterin phosphate synthase